MKLYVCTFLSEKQQKKTPKQTQIPNQINSVIPDHPVVDQTVGLARGRRENVWLELWGEVRTGSLSF